MANDLLTKMAQFPMALPLVIRNPDIDKRTLLIPLLRGITVKWETDKIIENSLFIDNFKLLVAVRIGENEYGKSTILNQLFATENIFSCKSEPGAECGKPRTVDGSVEFALLTEENCKATFLEEIN